MKSCTYLLIGGGLAAHNAAKKIRELDAAGSIVMICQEPHRPYDRPPLTKGFMQGKTPAEKVFLSEPEFYAQHHIEMLAGVAVTALDTQRKTATLADGRGIAFDKALLAMGGRPTRLTIPGVELPGVLTMRTLDDAQAISAQAAPGRHAVIIGGGFIGMELSASLTQRGARATILDSGPHIWSRFAGRELADYFQTYARQRGVVFHNSVAIDEIRGDDRAQSVAIQGGRDIPCDFVVVAAGIVPNVELAQQAGLTVDNGVVVDERLRTSHADLYAAGDLCNFYDPYAGRRRRVEHWGQADYTGALAGENMAGGQRNYDLLPYVFSDIFDLHLEFAGDEHQAQQTLLRGRYEDYAFAVLYLRDGVVSAFFSVNLKKKQFQPLQKLIEKRVDVRGKEKQLQDPAFDVLSLTAGA